MDMNSQKWINEVMNSLDGIRPAEVNPFTYNRILNKLETAEREYAPARLIWVTAASFALLLALNFIIIKQKNKKQDTGIEQMAEGLLNKSIINYN
jgi:hypothetical protein